MKILLIEGHPDEGAVVLNGTELLDLLPDNIQETKSFVKTHVIGGRCWDGRR